VSNIFFERSNARLEVFFLTSRAKMRTSTSTSSSTIFSNIASTSVHAGVRIASTGYFAPIASPTSRAVARPNVVNSGARTTVPAALESTVRFYKV